MEPNWGCEKQDVRCGIKLTKAGRYKVDFIMQKLEWDNSYSVGVDDFDAEHKLLFGFINDLRESLIGRKGKEIVDHVLNGLLDYANTHFFHEEILLVKHGYPDYEAHKAEHEKFLSEVRGLYVRFHADNSESKLISAEIIGVVTEWLQEHIMKIDRAYAPFLASKGVK
jgi:hemerythrin